MKKTLILIVTAAFAAALSTSALAQNAGPNGAQGTLQGANAGGKGQHRGGGAAFREVLAKLNLTKEQQDKVKDLFKKHMDAMKELHSATGDKESKRPKMKELNDNFHKDLLAILNPAQQAQFKAEMKKWHDQHKNDKPGGAGKSEGAGAGKSGG